MTTTLTAGCAAVLGSAPEPAEPSMLADRAASFAVRPEDVLTIDGYRPAAGGGGAFGADGYSVILLAEDSVEPVLLSVEPGGIDAGTCPDLPVLTVTGAVADGPVGCSADGDLFDRTAGTAREYAVERDGAVVRVSGEGVDPGTLRAAIEAVRVPTAAELDEILPAADGGAPVERGDLPPGDGAPGDGAGAGG